jgi:hypothetical protein
MKILNGNRCAGAAFAALLASIGLSPSAKAQFVLTYEDTTSGHAIGEAFTGGDFRINLQNFDNGALYPNLGVPGTSAGYGENGTGTQTLPGGIATLDALQTAGPTGGEPGEDTWGIARIISITDLAGAVIWSETGKNAQLTIMFHGEQDFYVQQLASGFQEINGVDMNVDMYFQSKTDVGYTAYDPLLGSGGRTGADDYTTVTDGTLILSLESTSGFIHDDGTLGGLATEFASNFNQTSGGTGQMYLSVTGGSEASQFNSNGFSSPFGAGTTADMFAQFTTAALAPGAVADWLVRSNDPVIGTVAQVTVPDGTASVSYGLMSAFVLMGFAALRRRVTGRV